MNNQAAKREPIPREIYEAKIMSAKRIHEIGLAIYGHDRYAASMATDMGISPSNMHRILRDGASLYYVDKITGLISSKQAELKKRAEMLERFIAERSAK